MSKNKPPIEYDICDIGINDDVLQFLRVKAEHGWLAWFMETDGMARRIYFRGVVHAKRTKRRDEILTIDVLRSTR